MQGTCEETIAGSSKTEGAVEAAQGEGIAMRQLLLILSLAFAPLLAFAASAPPPSGVLNALQIEAAVGNGDAEYTEANVGHCSFDGLEAYIARLNALIENREGEEILTFTWTSAPTTAYCALHAQQNHSAFLHAVGVTGMLLTAEAIMKKSALGRSQASPVAARARLLLNYVNGVGDETQKAHASHSLKQLSEAAL
jgi:hypothetical protein